MLVHWAGYAFCTFFASLYLAWILLAQANFLYPLGYRLLNIDDNISEYGPQNRNRNSFETTTSEEHARIFAEIVDAIHRGGEGLAMIEYRSSDGKAIDTLLTPPEIGHLTDVANLVDKGLPAGLISLLLWLAWTALLRFRRVPTLTHGKLFAGLGVGLFALFFALLIAGPTKVFYYLHTAVFPPEHPWFFYYQDSLMSTLMKAPDLFGFIGVIWILLALLIMGGILILESRLRR